MPAAGSGPVTISRLVFDAPYTVSWRTEKVDPAELCSSEVLVRVDHSLISPGTELALYTGSHVGIPDPANTFAKYPFLPGYSSVGRVVAAGPGVRDLAAGDRVFCRARHGSHGVVDRAAVYRLPAQLPDRAAVFARMAEISMTALTQAQAVLGGRSLVGVRVAVLGLGLVGNLAGQLFALLGARVVGVDLVEERLAVAARCGLDHVDAEQARAGVGPDTPGFAGDERPEVVVEATGSPALVETALRLVRPRGQVILLGSTRGTVELDVYKYIHSPGVFVAGAHEGLAGPQAPARDAVAAYVLRLIDRGALEVDALVTHVLPAAQAADGYERLLRRSDETLGVILNWRN